MPFVLTKTRAKCLFATMPHEFQVPKIFQHGHRPSAENFYSFLGIGSVAVCKVTDRALRSIRESQRNNHIVVGVLFQDRLHCVSAPRSAGRTGKKSQEIYKMADFPENSSAALLRIVDPVIACDKTSVDAVMQRHRLLHYRRNAFIFTAIGANRRLKPTISKEPRNRLAYA